jgi:putative ABC transport system ATP-binding protein
VTDDTHEAARSGRALLEARDLQYSFGETHALRGVTVTVDAGEVLAVMGRSGSGKSTLLHCLAGIYLPDSGEVWFDGARLDSLPDAERTRLRRTDFAFVFQFGQLVPELTVADNVALPLLFNGVKKREAYERAETWLERLELAGFGSRRTGQMSGGQAQRVALARALAINPKVLFADEPTGALDTTTGERVIELLVAQAKAQGASVVLVTHDSRVAAYADRTIEVRDGLVSGRSAGVTR